MIYVTGDTHGERERFLNNTMGDEAWTSEDTLIVCGDFGFLFFNNATENAFLDFLQKEKPYTVCFCDGNHENFDAIYAYPQEEWHGGRIHRIRKNVVHLMRGQVFELEGHSFFTFGGAYSIDKEYRREGFSWWPQELPSPEEYDTAWAALEKHGFAVDYIITHTAPQAVVEKLIAKQPWDIRREITMEFKDYELLEFLGKVHHTVSFSHWYFGHWHFDTEVDERCTALLKKVCKL